MKLVRFEDDNGLSVNYRKRNNNSLFCWSAFILLLTLFAASCWVGSYYIFGCPEKPWSYKVLKKLKKLENIQRFELTTAPRGEFLDAKALLQRYGAMSAHELEDVNVRLLRNFIRNYRETRDLVPYVIGSYTVLDSFELNAQHFFASGIVSIAQSMDFPMVLLESVFTAEQQSVSLIRSTLLTGLNIRLEKRLDLSALIHVKCATDGRMLFTTLPILYGSYSSQRHPGRFSLSPPKILNIKAGLPIVSQKKIAAADTTYCCYRRQSKLSSTLAKAIFLNNQDSSLNNTLTDKAAPASDSEKGTLIRIERPARLQKKSANPSLSCHSSYSLASSKNTNTSTVHTAFPTSREISNISSTRRGIVASPMTSTFTGSSKETMSAISPAQPADLQERNDKFLIRQSASEHSYLLGRQIISPKNLTIIPIYSHMFANISDGNWKTYKAGKMPLGRLLDSSDLKKLIEDSFRNERLYLKGKFLVTASCLQRAVLRPKNFRPFFLGNRVEEVRIIVDFPSSSAVPKLGFSLQRGSHRPFLITDIQRSSVGIINVFAREITHD